MSEAQATMDAKATESKAAEAAGTNSTARTAQEESMQVKLSRLDNMLELAGEVIIISSNLNALGRQVQEGQEVHKALAEDIKDLAITSNRISSDLHNLVTDVRTVDMSDLSARFRRLARDTARRLGKAIRFEVTGEDICIDKKMSEKIYDPIAHQIRNAMAHGIEDAETRGRLGKDPVGTVRLDIRQTENMTVVEVSDDGAGIDPEKIRRKLRELGWVDEERLEKLSESELQEYLFMPGFSTAEQASATSGRGVGMDVIRTMMQEVNGETQIQTEIGKGTVFGFLLPKVTAVNISDALLIRANGTYFAFPISSIVATKSVGADEVSTTKGQYRSIEHLGNLLPVFDLMAVFGEREIAREAGDELRVVIVEYKSHRVAYEVSDFLNPQKIVISEFNENMQVRGLLGTAVLSGRQLCMVVDLPKLFALTLGAETVQEQRKAGQGAEGNLPKGQAAEPAVTKDKAVKKEGTVKAAAQAAPTGVMESIEGEQERPGLEFLQEVASMLARLNKELLALEEEVNKEKADGVFRLVHSIKGNLTMYGAEEPAAVTHRIETLLEGARQGEALTQEAFDVLFDGSSYLEEAVGACLEGGAIPEVSEKLREALRERRTEVKEQKPESGGDPTQIALDATGEFYLSSRRRDGATVYQARIEFDAGDQPAFLVAYLILRRIQRVADVLGTRPRMAEIEEGLCGGEMSVLFGPRDERGDLIERLGENLKRYFGVTHFEAQLYA